MEATRKIILGDNKWLEWISFDQTLVPTYPIDKIIEPIIYFLERLETVCIAHCCGIDAFSFRENDIIDALKNMNTSDLFNEFDIVKSKISTIRENILMSTFLNQYIHKDVFIRIIEHIIHVINDYCAQPVKQSNRRNRKGKNQRDK